MRVVAGAATVTCTSGLLPEGGALRRLRMAPTFGESIDEIRSVRSVFRLPRTSFKNNHKMKLVITAIGVFSFLQRSSGLSRRVYLKRLFLNHPNLRPRTYTMIDGEVPPRRSYTGVDFNLMPPATVVSTPT